MHRKHYKYLYYYLNYCANLQKNLIICIFSDIIFMGLNCTFMSFAVTYLQFARNRYYLKFLD